MPECAEVRERKSGMGDMKQLSTALHDLCQPLTTLQCRLELAELVGTLEAYREAVELGLAECDRLAEGVRSMREMVRAATCDGSKSSCLREG